MFRVLIISCFFLIACKTQEKKESVIDSEIICFSSFQFGSRTPDTVRLFPVTSSLFKQDTLIILKTDKYYNWYVEKVKLSIKEIDTINSLIKAIDFKSYINKNSLQKRNDSLIMYCGSNYGLINNQKNIEVFIPYDDGRNIRDLEKVLYNIKAFKTNDTSEIIDYTIKMKRKYLRDRKPFPVMEPVKFVPPVVKPDMIEK
jgi:hypothetical protein